MDTDSIIHVLVINAGSSSIKFALFELKDRPKRIFEATVSNIGQSNPILSISDLTATNNLSRPVTAANHTEATKLLIAWLRQRDNSESITAIGHRIVHGGPKYHRPTIITDDVLADLRKLMPFDPQHLPAEIELVETFKKLFPGVKQIACFDTAFHHDLPTVARLLPIPRLYEKRGIRRYGFHGLSYQYVMQELKRLGIKDSRLILAHLGNGVSLVAVHDGKSVDTTMALTPAAGVPMSTRSGDLDPGLPLYLATSEGMDIEQFNEMVHSQSGLLGVSETTSDMKKLLELENHDARAKDAVDIFCYQLKKSIGSLAAALGGLDGLIFTGGMGENAPIVRARICEGLQFLGIELDETRNASSEDLISADESTVAVRVIHTDESSTIAREVWELIGKGSNQ